MFRIHKNGLILLALAWLAFCFPVHAATLTVTSDAVDGYVTGQNASYATARSTSTSLDSAATTLIVGQDTTYWVRRGFLKFDTSAIPDMAEISQVNLRLTATTDSTTTDFDVQIVKLDWSAQDPLSAGNREAAYDACRTGTADSNIWRNTSGMSVNTPYDSGNLDTPWVSKTGSTYYCLRSSRDFAGTTPTNTEHIYIASATNGTTAYRPQLVVTYSIPPFLRPIIISQIADWWNEFEGRFVR